MVRQMRHFTEADLPKYLTFYWFLSQHYNPIKGCYPPDLLEIYLRMLSKIYHFIFTLLLEDIYVGGKFT
jgi:hypothetical protein